MSKIKTMLALYLILVVILFLALLGMLAFADNATFPQTWLDKSIATILDMIKVVIGAAVGSLSTAFAMVIEITKKGDAGG